MRYWDKTTWKSIKKDIQKGWKEGVAVVKEGAVVAQKKAGEATEEGKRRYKLFELKTKIHKRVYDLGERVHVLLSGRKKVKNPALDATFKTIMADIGRMEAQIKKLAVKKDVSKPARKRKRA
jgi:hypothetical protein